MPLPSFAELFAGADAQRPGVSVVAAGGADPTVLQALRAACDRGWVRPQLTGARADIERVASEQGIGLDGFEVIDSDDAAGAAVARVRQGAANLLMKGQIATPTLMQAVLRSETGLRTGRVVCQVVLMELRGVGRRFLLADTGITPRPTLEQKLDILRSAVELAHLLGEPMPKVAVMSASEKVTEALPDTLEAAELQRRGEAGEIAGCVVQGPMSFDLAYASEAGQRKGLGGPVAGAADVMLFPDLLSANLTVKAIMYTADSRFGGVLMGTACPVVFMSRADSSETRLRSLALALRLIR
jgi:phosphate butyryltransferase